MSSVTNPRLIAGLAAGVVGLLAGTAIARANASSLAVAETFVVGPERLQSGNVSMNVHKGRYDAQSSKKHIYVEPKGRVLVRIDDASGVWKVVCDTYFHTHPWTTFEVKEMMVSPDGKWNYTSLVRTVGVDKGDWTLEFEVMPGPAGDYAYAIKRTQHQDEQWWLDSCTVTKK